jgi:hypothetical protein
VGILNKSARWRESAWWIGAATLPGLLRVLLIASSSSGRWGALPPYIWARVSAEALVLESIAIAIGAPLMGVAAVHRGKAMGGAWIARACALPVVAFVLGGVVASMVLQPGAELSALVPPYSTLLMATLAMSSLGAAAAAWLEHPLDAAAYALVLSLALGLGLFAAGPLLEGAPAALVNTALLASPVVAVASAADIDLLRGEPLYRFSPIAHSQFEYPAWPTACGIYAAIAVVCVAFVVVTSSNRGRRLSAERITV